jgi:ankyrin repeat protein
MLFPRRGTPRTEMEEFTLLINGNPSLIRRRAGKNQWTPLQEAAYRGSKDIVEFLLAKGAEINASFPGDGPAAWTPLHCAAVQGHGDIVDLLLAAGARTDIRDDAGLRYENAALLYNFRVNKEERDRRWVSWSTFFKT